MQRGQPCMHAAVVGLGAHHMYLTRLRSRDQAMATTKWRSAGHFGRLHAGGTWCLKTLRGIYHMDADAGRVRLRARSP